MERTIFESEYRCNHCATIAPCGEGMAIAYYAGYRECDDSQHVVLTYRRPDGSFLDSGECVHLENNGGNPLLFRQNDKTFLIYSIFEKTAKEVSHIVQRWMYCSLWAREISFDGQLSVGEKFAVFKNPQIGFLCRISAFDHDGKTFLPLYHEGNCYGAIFEWSGELKQVSKIGYKCDNLIQPSIWFDGSIFHSLSRNSRPHEYGMSCWYSKSSTLRRWSHPELEQSLDNANNSIAVVNDGRPDPLVIWNAGNSRHSLMLGKLKGHSLGRQYAKICQRGYGAYPNYSFDALGNLHLVWTDAGRRFGQLIIAHMMLTKAEYEKLRG